MINKSDSEYESLGEVPNNSVLSNHSLPTEKAQDLQFSFTRQELIDDKDKMGYAPKME